VGLTGVIIARLTSTATGGLGYPLWVGILAALVVASLIGLIQGLLITRLRLQPFIVTLGGMLLLRGVSQTVVDGGVISMGKSSLLDLASGGLFHVGSDPLIPYPFLMFLAVAALGTYVLHFTVLGRYIYAIGGSRDAAEYSGINVKRVETLTYVISAASAGVAGICYAAYIGQMSQQVGVAYELYAIAAAVLGGCSLRGGEGTIFGIVIGTAIMRVIDNGINMFQYKYTDADGIRRIWAAQSELELDHRRRRHFGCSDSRSTGAHDPSRAQHPRSGRTQSERSALRWFAEERRGSRRLISEVAELAGLPSVSSQRRRANAPRPMTRQQRTRPTPARPRCPIAVRAAEARRIDRCP